MPGGGAAVSKLLVIKITHNVAFETPYVRDIFYKKRHAQYKWPPALADNIAFGAVC